jgi:hypothetical protein
MGILDCQFKKPGCDRITTGQPEFSGVYPDVEEPLGGYASFAGDGYVNTQEVYDYSQNGDFSVSVWAKSTNPSANYAVVQAHLVGASYSSDWIIVGGNSLFWMRSQALGNISLMNDSNWHHLVLVWDRAVERFRGFFDGENIGQSNVVAGYGAVTPIVIGARADFGSSFWTGGIAQVKVYRRKLSDAEVKNLFKFNPVLNGLYSYYPLVSNGKDYGQNRKHAVVQNAVFSGGL